MTEHGASLFVRTLSAMTPMCLAVAFAMLANLPISLTDGLLPAPLLSLAPVYFFTLVRPDLMPPVAVLLIGLLEDLLSRGAPGIWGAAYLAAYALTDRNRDALAGFAGIGAVLGFAAAMLLAAAAAYALASIAYWRLPPVAPLLVMCVLTIAIYPLLAYVMGGLQRRLVGPMRGEI